MCPVLQSWCVEQMLGRAMLPRLSLTLSSRLPCHALTVCLLVSVIILFPSPLHPTHSMDLKQRFHTSSASLVNKTQIRGDTSTQRLAFPFAPALLTASLPTATSRVSYMNRNEMELYLCFEDASETSLNLTNRWSAAWCVAA